MYLGCINLCHTWSWQLFFWLSWEQCICHPCSFYAGCLACYMLHFNGKNLISERSLKLVPLHTTIPTKGITNESQWSRSCQPTQQHTLGQSKYDFEDSKQISRKNSSSWEPNFKFKSAILAIFQFWQNGTFEPVHGIQNFFRPQDFFWSVI